MDCGIARQRILISHHPGSVDEDVGAHLVGCVSCRDFQSVLVLNWDRTAGGSGPTQVPSSPTSGFLDSMLPKTEKAPETNWLSWPNLVITITFWSVVATCGGCWGGIGQPAKKPTLGPEFERQLEEKLKQWQADQLKKMREGARDLR